MRAIVKLLFILLVMSGISDLLDEIAQDSAPLSGSAIALSPSQPFIPDQWPPALADLFLECQHAEPDRGDDLRRQRSRVEISHGSEEEEEVEEEADFCVSIESLVDSPDDEVIFEYI